MDPYGQKELEEKNPIEYESSVGSSEEGTNPSEEVNPPSVDDEDKCAHEEILDDDNKNLEFVSVNVPVKKKEKTAFKPLLTCLQCKLSTLVLCCLSFTLFFCCLSILLSLMFFLVFHFSEQTEYGKKISTKEDEKESLLDLKMNSLTQAASSIYSFYEGSSFVDYGEYKTFCESISNGLIETIEWVEVVPHSNISYYNSTLSNKKLPTELELQLTHLSFDPTPLNHFIVTYMWPYEHTTDFVNIGGTNFGNDLSTDSTRASSIYAAFSTLSKKYLHIEGDGSKSSHKLELYIPVKKSELALSLEPKSNQNGIIRGVFNLEKLISESFDDSEMNYYLEVNDEYAFSSNEKDSSKEEASDSVNKKVTKNLDGVVLGIEMEPRSGFRDSPFIPLKWIFLLLPCFFCCFAALINCSICLCCRSWIVTRYQNKLIRSVVNSIVSLNFEDPVIMKIEKSRSRSGTTRGMLKKLIKQIRLYRKFLPQTLLAQIEEKQADSETTEFSRKSSEKKIKENESEGEEGDQTLTNDSTISSYDGSESGSENSKNSRSSSGKGVNRVNRKKLQMDSYLGNFEEREIILMIVSVDQIERLFLRSVSHKKTHLFRKMYTSMNQILLEVVGSRKGDFHSFSSRGTMFSWGAVRRRIGGSLDALKASLEIIKHPFFVKNKLSPRVSICKGASIMGNFEIRNGNTSLRQFDMIGFPSFYCSLMNRLARKMDAKIVVDQSVQKSLKFNTENCVVDYVRFGKNKPQKIFEVFKVISNEDDEWFYELDAMKKKSNDVYQHVEYCWDLLISNKREEAEKTMTETIKKDGSQHKAFARFAQALEKTKSLPEDERYVKECDF